MSSNSRSCPNMHGIDRLLMNRLSNSPCKDPSPRRIDQGHRLKTGNLLYWILRLACTLSVRSQIFIRTRINLPHTRATSSCGENLKLHSMHYRSRIPRWHELTTVALSMRSSNTHRIDTRIHPVPVLTHICFPTLDTYETPLER